MRNFTFLMIFSLIALFAGAQNATFDWVETELSNGHILQKMTVNGDIGIIAGYGNTLLKSTDTGETWDTLDYVNALPNLPDISVKGTVGYIVTSRKKMYDASPDVYISGVVLKTEDGGNNWITLSAATFGTDDNPALSPSATLSCGLDFQSVETVNDSVAFCALRWFEYTTDGYESHSGVFKTTNGGNDWINVSGDLGGSTITSITFCDDVGFVGGLKMLYKATTTSDTLIDVFASMPGDGSDYVADISMVDSSEIYLVTVADSIYFSNDGGTTFDKFGTVKGGWDFIKVNDSTFVMGGSKNKSVVSTDNGQTWSSLGIATSVWEIAGVINDSINMLTKAAIYKCAVADLVSGNYNWVKQPVGDNNLQKAFIADDNNVIVVGNNANFFKTTDAGLTWNPVPLPHNDLLDAVKEEIDISDLSNIGDEAYLCFHRFKFVDYPKESDNEDIYWPGGVFYTTNNWETAKSIDMAKVGKADSDDPSKNPNHSTCFGFNPSVVKYLGNKVVLLWARWYEIPKVEHSRIFKTTDGGKNWVVISDDYGSNYIQAIAAKGDTLLVGGKEILLKSVNGGTDFTDLYPILDEGEDDKMFINMIRLGGENEFFVTTSVDSVYMTTDCGNSFKTIGGVKGANDFYKFDTNSWIFMGSSSKNKFTNTAGESWDDCYPGSTIFEIGGVYGDKFYALGKSKIFTNLVKNFDLTTSVKEIKLDNELTVRYKPLSIEMVSEKEIERCKVYSITGKLISDYEPNNRSYELQRSNFQPGIYILDATIEGKRHTKKIVF
jgi:photosystem II stability/assembly factor-like uncharacterized protein